MSKKKKSKEIRATEPELRNQPQGTPVWVRFLFPAVVILLMIIGSAYVFADWWVAIPADAKSAYVGRNKCIDCHTQQAKEFEGSHHDLAMDLAIESTVLGDFDNAEIEHFGLTSRFFRDGEKYMVHTEGPDGKMADFEIKYVFGVDPLQQYMVEFDRTKDTKPGEIARLQVLRLSWDTAGKKWFYLPPPDVDEKLAPTDDLHWTGIAQCWNTMCADCHSTDLKRGFDTKTTQYHTTFSEIDVSCEACHGPGGIHVQLAESNSLFWDRVHGYGLPKLKSEDSHIEIETCAQCHSRRRILHADFRPGNKFHDHFAEELIQPNIYHADGQILDEVYVYGSFIQSRMYHKGIRCTDCHNPHTTKLKHEGNKLCTSCHQHPAGKYDGPAHHHHDPKQAGASCVDCHMPESTYMELDHRRDHSLRIPRPDLSVALDTPNSCTGCHLKLENSIEKIPADERKNFKQYNDWLLAARTGHKEAKAELDRLDAWAAEASKKWYGDKERKVPLPTVEDHFANAFTQSRDELPSGADALAKVALDKDWPAMVRATAYLDLNRYNTGEALAAARKGLTSKDEYERAMAITNFEPLIPATGSRELPEEEKQYYIEALRPMLKDLLPLLSDPSRLVRTEAARVLARVPESVNAVLFTSSDRKAFGAAIAEFKGSLKIVNERAAAHLTLGVLYENLGNDEKAIEAYETAMRVEPRVTGPRTNLAAIFERLRGESDRAARQAAMQRDRTAVAIHARKVAEYDTRLMQLRGEELQLLARDSELAPDNAIVQYRYGLSLSLHGDFEGAEKALKRAVELAPDNAQFQLGLALLYHEKLDRPKDAFRHAKIVLELEPGVPGYQQLMKDIRAKLTPDLDSSGE